MLDLACDVYLRYESRVWGALGLHAAGPVALGLGVLPVFHGGAARSSRQLVLHFTEEKTSKELKIWLTEKKIT